LNVAAESPTRYLEGHSRAVLAATFLDKDDGPLTGGVDASIRLWDVPNRTTRRVLSNHTSAINDLKVRPSDDPQALPMLASASDDRTVRFWQPTIGRLVRFARLDSVALALAWSADGRIVWAACKDGRLRGIDPTDASEKSVQSVIDGVAYSLAVAPDGRILVAGSNGQLQITGEQMTESR
jgi:WD40 repeat protein